MALLAYQLRIAGPMASSSKEGIIPVSAKLVTTESPVAIEAAGYFNPAAGRLPKGSHVDATMSHGGTPVRRGYIITSNDGTTVVAARQSDDDAAGAAVRAVVPTADGLTTGLILDTDSFVEATSADANHILTLPLASAATRGREIWIWVVPAVNCELRTPALSNQTINNVDSDASEALLTHTQLYVARQHLATGWLLQAFTALGAVAAAIVPD
ncbi:hypothetical protein [Mesorhizobium sp.]|uniref:hypothetical protein n=1 Tax=Mesorhizobium sp. TaxID=1871066 RepID=UPI000FE69269|nr:hypothetical protein [Mesorhizobium sp.]RWE91351.1 MAG: hypothetical protein EOS68_28265 [Mesorhizobium sp.]